MCDNVGYHPTALSLIPIEALAVRSSKVSTGHLAKFQTTQHFLLNSIRSSGVLLGYGAEMLGVKWTSSGHFFVTLNSITMVIW